MVVLPSFIMSDSFVDGCNSQVVDPGGHLHLLFGMVCWRLYARKAKDAEGSTIAGISPSTFNLLCGI